MYNSKSLIYEYLRTYPMLLFISVVLSFLKDIVPIYIVIWMMLSHFLCLQKKNVLIL